MPQSTSLTYSPMRILASVFFLLILSFSQSQAQLPSTFQWSKDGKAFYEVNQNEIVRIDLEDMSMTTVVESSRLRPAGDRDFRITGLQVTEQGDKFMLFTNTRKVWRYETRGDYWVFDTKTSHIQQIGKSLPEASLMFAKFSPDGNKAAYVSSNNLYVEDLKSGQIRKLTNDGGGGRINGTFDWVYEEEFGCRDGFRWSPDSKTIAYWQIDASKIRSFLMINNTDSIYSFTVPVEYPKTGENPAPYRIGVVDIVSSVTRWMKLPGDPQNTYLPRMEFAGNPGELVAQQLNRKQNESTLLYINTKTGATREFFHETDPAWIETKSVYDDDPTGWDWLNNGKEFVWISEKEGWRQAYRISRDGKREVKITRGAYDIIKPLLIDESGNNYFFLASPHNATQAYLYRTPLDGSGNAERLSPVNQSGTHDYKLSPNGRFAHHAYSTAKTYRTEEWVSLPDHRTLFNSGTGPGQQPGKAGMEFFKVKTQSGVELDGWLIKPDNFDAKNKYPIVFYVYGEPAASTVLDTDRTGIARHYVGSMASDGYIYASLDNRGTPAPKGRSWRKAIYRNIGTINIRDQAEGALAMFEKFPFIDKERVAVHGHSGGGSSTLNLLFQYPEIYQTGISVAALTNLLTYDNIYQERFMGVPQETHSDYIKGSPVTHARHLKGNLLYIHGTGDDNVHYQNAELLINELVKHNKQFQFMSYPNRTHGIREGEGTIDHMATLFTDFLKKNCPPGPRPVQSP